MAVKMAVETAWGNSPSGDRPLSPNLDFAMAAALEGIAMNEVRKKLFSISLSGKAAHWYKLLKNGDSLDWEDIVPLFYSKFYPPSEIHKDRNRIYNFWPHDGESIAQAWGRLKSLMLKCPIHELPGNVIIDNFYARLSFQDKTLLDTSCSGSFTRNKEEFKRDLLDRIEENTEGWENDKDRESGTARKIEDNPRVLLELYREITNDDCRTIQRGKIRNIQLPVIKYFAYYLATSILGRENTSNISSYHLAFLIAALTGETPYHLGSVIARRLSNKGPIYGGIIASRILARLDLPLDPNDVEIPPVKLDIAAMKSHQFVTIDSSMDNIVYRMLFADGDEREVLLPQTDLFSIDRKPWSRSKEEVDEQLKIQGFHQQHDSEDAEPSYDYTVTYPVASSSTYLEPGCSSSYYGDTTSWGPWNELHLGQKPKLGGRYTGITHSLHIMVAGYLYILV
ncbi:hypothetical protein QYE76_056744 [Lolium multiflorum]|uniref:Retrotransposon gag domain-containing protein n=1 Tax=Lolium multiflorum TaxID=4521 RepID=A0AAD8T345_LOLMU|nr:hypothetical protein QYE76_056744 [Lolium multiflorum]